MVLPLNLAMTPAEIAAAEVLPENLAWMACCFSSTGDGLEQVPEHLPEGSLLILNDRIPCSGHSAATSAEILRQLVSRFHCCGLLLDFQRPQSTENAVMAEQLVRALPCPVAVSAEYARPLSCPVFLPPVPLHLPLQRYLQPWKGRQIWLEAALQQERVCITESGAIFSPPTCAEQAQGGFHDKTLACNYRTSISRDRVTFTLFDTPQTLKEKLMLAHALGVSRAVGLYQELGVLLPDNNFP